MPKALAKLKHPLPHLPQHAPHVWTITVYGQNQYRTSENSSILNKNVTTQLQAISDTLLYYSRDVDPTILPALKEMSNQHVKPTENTAKKLMKYF